MRHFIFATIALLISLIAATGASLAQESQGIKFINNWATNIVIFDDGNPSCVAAVFDQTVKYTFDMTVYSNQDLVFTIYVPKGTLSNLSNKALRIRTDNYNLVVINAEASQFGRMDVITFTLGSKEMIDLMSSIGLSNSLSAQVMDTSDTLIAWDTHGSKEVISWFLDCAEKVYPAL